MRKRMVLRKQDGGAVPRQVRICPVLLDYKSNDFTLEIVGFFAYRLASFGFDHNAKDFIWSNECVILT